MKYRTLGRTGIKVSEIGFGTWQLGDELWGGLHGNDAIHLVHKALEEGCNFFDTAPPYGNGMSEKILGKALKGRRSEAVIVTKFGHKSYNESDFSANAIRKSVENSLRSLQTDYIDGLLLHNPTQSILKGHEGHFELMETLKNEGKVRSYGASIDSSYDLNCLLKQPGVEVAEVYINALQQECAQAFAAASMRGVGLIAKVPLDSGWLSGKYSRETVFTTGFRDRWTKDVKERRYRYVEKLKFLVNETQTMAQAALRFLLHYTELSTLIPGAKNTNQLLNNLNASNKRLSEDDVTFIKNMWDSEISTDPLPW